MLLSKGSSIEIYVFYTLAKPHFRTLKILQRTIFLIWNTELLPMLGLANWTSLSLRMHLELSLISSY